jgi:predicted regulator of Ras-like GTPase activity (Roadblock/LC7/MglB family)
MTTKKSKKPAVVEIDSTEVVEGESAEDQLEERFALIAEMMQLAESLLNELKTGESVETVKDADVAIEEAREFARQILAFKSE